MIVLRKKNILLYHLPLATYLFFMTGCATTEYKALPGTTTTTTTTTVIKKQGIYHKVQKGQTLFRIAQAYGVGIKDIIDSNNIPNAAAIEVDQLLFIPGATEAKDLSVRTPDQNKDEFAWPIKGKVVVYFNDALGSASSHGIDIQAQSGDIVKAAREGAVSLADYLGGYGQTIMIDHGDGFISVYAQNSKLLVKLGDHVYKGDPIAEVGAMGSRVVEHFEIRKGSQATNPLYYLP